MANKSLNELKSALQTLEEHNEICRATRESCKPTLEKIHSSYAQKSASLDESYKENQKRLKRDKSAELNVARADCYIDEHERNQAANEVQAIYDSFAIDTETMLSIMKETTGLNWKTIKIAGEYWHESEEYTGKMFKCGFGLIDETHPHYNKDSINSTENDEHFVVVKNLSASQKDFADDFSISKGFNWTSYYLMHKGINVKKYFKFDKFGIRKSDFIVNAIDSYFQGRDAESEDESAK